MNTRRNDIIESEEIDRLVKIRESTADGTIPRPEYDKALERMGKAVTAGTRGSLRRKVSKTMPAPERPTEGLDFSESVLVLLASCPSLQAFHAYFVAINHPTIPYPTFWYHFREKVDHRLASLVKPGRGSMQAFRFAILSCLWHCDSFGQAWQIDVCTLPFKVRVPGYHYPVRVKLICIIDDATRLIVGWDLVYATDGRDVRGGDVCAVMIAAMSRYGIPQQIVMDNGKEFDNRRINQMLRACVVTPRFTPRYRGERKGKIERFFGTLGRWMVFCYPSWTAGKNSSARYTLLGGDDAHAPDAETAHHFVTDLIDVRYNTERVHRSIGMTPADARAADPTELRQLNLLDVLKFAPVHKEGTKQEFVKVQNYGINHNNEIFTNLDIDSPGRKGRSGAHSLARMRHNKYGVRLRPVPGDPTRAGVYNIDDNFICIATNMRNIPTHIKLAHSSENDQLLHVGEGILAEAHAAAAAGMEVDTDPDVDAEVRDVILGDAIANLVDTTANRVARYSEDLGLGGSKAPLPTDFYIDDTAVVIDVHTAADLLMIWADAQDQDTYRVDTPNQSVTWDTARATAQLADKDTGEITFFRVVRT